MRRIREAGDMIGGIRIYKRRLRRLKLIIPRKGNNLSFSKVRKSSIIGRINIEIRKLEGDWCKEGNKVLENSVKEERLKSIGLRIEFEFEFEFVKTK